MKNHSLKRVISAVLTGLIILSLTTFAFAAEPANLDFYVTETNEDIVELKLSVRNATLMGMQVAVRYNPEALIPVDEDLNLASKFQHFATLSEDAKFFSSIGLSLDSKKGFFEFTLYIMPGTEEEGINEYSEFTADDNGLDLYTFRFKKIKDESFDFEIATKDDKKPYQVVAPEGLILLNHTDSLEALITFKYDEENVVKTTIKPQPPVRVDKELTSKERKQDVICLQINKPLTVAYGKKALIDPDDTSVVPYISNNRTMVPLRFVAETLGAEVLWEEGWDGCVIKKDGTEIELTFGSAEFKVNGEKVVYDAPIVVTNNRTMVPVRFVSEQLGCHIYWNQLNKAVVISPKDNPWVEDRKAEITAINEMLVTILGLI